MSDTQETQNQQNINRILIREKKRVLFFGLPLSFTTYTLKERKLLVNNGLLSTTEDEILLYRVLDITLKRSLAQRLFGLGSVIVTSQDKTLPHLVMKNIKNSQQFKELLSAQIESEKLRLRMYRSEVVGGGPPNDEFCDHFDENC